MEGSDGWTDSARGAVNGDDGKVRPPVVDGYRLNRLLGQGATAQVWLANNIETGQAVAAKVLSTPGEAETMRLISRELALLRRYPHEHLVRAHEVLEAEGRIVLLLDYAAGGSLAQLVAARGPLPVAEVVTIMTPIAGCLSYLHGNGLVHGDLAPGNVLFTEHGKPLLADLGMSQVLGEKRTGRAGTEGFADPYADEVQHGLVPERDIYGLGALSWYALTGRVPARTERRPPLSLLVPGTPTDLAQLIEAALAPQHKDRPSAAEFERTVFASDSPAPVDLVPVAHESVLPQLLTRRELRLERRSRIPGLRRLTVSLAGSRRAGARAAAVDEGRSALKQRRAWVGRRLRSGHGRGMRVLAALLALLVTGTAAGALAEHFAASSGSAGAAAPSSAGAAGTAPAPALHPHTRNGAGIRAPDGLPAQLLRRLSADDPAVAVRALGRLRGVALSTGRVNLLEQVNLAGSPAMRADQTLVQRLEAGGQHLDGLRIEVQSADIVRGPDAGRAVVAVAVATSDSTVQDAAGTSAVRVAGGRQQLYVSLVQERGRWLIDRILAPAGAE